MSDFTKTIVGAISGFVVVMIIEKIMESSKKKAALAPVTVVSGMKR